MSRKSKPKTLYLNEDLKELLNVIIAIKGFNSYEETVAYCIDVYYEHIKNSVDNEK